MQNVEENVDINPPDIYKPPTSPYPARVHDLPEELLIKSGIIPSKLTQKTKNKFDEILRDYAQLSPIIKNVKHNLELTDFDIQRISGLSYDDYAFSPLVQSILKEAKKLEKKMEVYADVFAKRNRKERQKTLMALESGRR